MYVGLQMTHCIALHCNVLQNQCILWQNAIVMQNQCSNKNEDHWRRVLFRSQVELVRSSIEASLSRLSHVTFWQPVTTCVTCVIVTLCHMWHRLSHVTQVCHMWHRFITCDTGCHMWDRLSHVLLSHTDVMCHLEIWLCGTSMTCCTMWGCDVTFDICGFCSRGHISCFLLM